MERSPLIAILTNSTDGTSDALSEVAGEAEHPIFRWNVDLWREYDLSFDAEQWLVTDPVGRTIDLAARECVILWRKPFLNLMSFEGLGLAPADEIQARRQLGQFLHGVVALAGSQRRLRLVDPHGDRRVPKLFQLHVGRQFYCVPASHFGIHRTSHELGAETITKPLGDPGVGEDRIFFTRRVDANSLFRPYPWFLQEAVIGGQDVTCVYITGRCHFFVCDFVREGEAVDWRVEINSQHQSRWQKLSHEKLAEWEEQTVRFMRRLKLHYGRLDFILKNDTLFFLECNSNGQFGWLDDPGSLTLHREFFAAVLCPKSAVT